MMRLLSIVKRTAVRIRRESRSAWQRRGPGPSSVSVSSIVDAAQRPAAVHRFSEGSSSMLSAAEQSVLSELIIRAAPRAPRVAELGTYLGGTTCLFGSAMSAAGCRGTIEVYDLFEHNNASRKRLRSHPLYHPDDFFAIWEHNTRDHAAFIELHRGDLRVTGQETAAPLWMLYVDIVKHPSVIGPVMESFVGRLEIGGLLVHPDYFHWQSPWVVYTTEAMLDHFEIAGTVSNHMMVLRCRSAVPRAVLERDYLSMPWAEKDALFQRAIRRFTGVRAGLLRVSRLNLLVHEGRSLDEAEIASIRSEHAGAPRVLRYLDEVVRTAGHGRRLW